VYSAHSAPADGGVGAGLQDGWTPLICAAEKGHIVIVDKLLAASADLNIQNEVCATSPSLARTCLRRTKPTGAPGLPGSFLWYLPLPVSGTPIGLQSHVFPSGRSRIYCRPKQLYCRPRHNCFPTALAPTDGGFAGVG
jgi:hypothetical protein